jgi:hypothetical protein
MLVMFFGIPVVMLGIARQSETNNASNTAVSNPKLPTKLLSVCVFLFSYLLTH